MKLFRVLSRKIKPTHKVAIVRIVKEEHQKQVTRENVQKHLLRKN